jgi:soluble lytic murein transglycosylase-like protein
MFRLPSLRHIAALFVCCAGPLSALPAAAGPLVPAPRPASETSYAAVLRTINPQLPMRKARAYARSLMANAWRTHLDPRFIMSIVTVESRWHANAVSRSGARGLGQLMPATAAGLGVNAWSPSENLRGTSSYLKSLMDHFARKPNGVTLAIAGYNAGPRAVERYRGIPPYAETQHYVVRVLSVWKQLKLRVGRAFATPVTSVAVHPGAPLPDVRQWVTEANSVLPATAAAVDASPNPVLTPNAADAAAATHPAGETVEPAK